MAELLNGNQQWVDSSGAPLLNGKVYIGVVNSDPVANPKNIFSNRALSSALTNPQTLDSQGFSTNKIWLSGQYSIRVETSAAVLVKQELDNGEADQVSVSGLSTVAGINAITATNTPTITTYTDKNQFIFQVASLNTTDAVTLNVDGVGAKAIKRNFDQDVGKGKFKADQTVIVAYNSGKDYFEWINTNARVMFQTEGAAIASASTIDLSLATGNALSITGSTGPITSLGTVTAGVEFTLTFASTPTLTHNATSLILPGNANIVVRAGDIGKFLSLGSGNFICTSFQREAQAPESGSLVLLATVTASSSATADFDTGIDFSVYKHFQIHIISMIPATDDVEAWMRFSNDSGSTYEESTYYSAGLYIRSGSATVIPETHAGINQLRLSGVGATISDGSGEGGFNAIVDIFDPNNSAIYTAFKVTSEYQRATATEIVMFIAAGDRNVSETVNGIRILFESGNISTGTIKLYGVV